MHAEIGCDFAAAVHLGAGHGRRTTTIEKLGSCRAPGDERGEIRPMVSEVSPDAPRRRKSLSDTGGTLRIGCRRPRRPESLTMSAGK